MGLGMRGAVRRVGRRQGRGWLPAGRRPGRHGMAENGDHPAWVAQRRLRGPCPRASEKDADTENCAPP
jgi:hypothetical protein